MIGGNNMKKIWLGIITTIIAITIAIFAIINNKDNNNLIKIKLADTTLTSRTYMNLSKVCT